MTMLPPVLRLMLLPVLNVLGPILVGFSLSMLIPLALSLWKNDGAEAGFEIAFCITFFTGLFLWLSTRRFKRELIPRDGFLLVTMAWVLLALAATIPLYVNIENISFIHAFFEATSGITTTCATILSGLDRLPISVNFWRCFLAWMGGIGILVTAVAVLPLLGVGGAQIFRAESTGPLKEGRLTPRIADTAKAFYNIYFAISVVCAVCYHFAGMDWDDAIMHTFTTVSLGGYSSHDASFAYWSSRTVDWVCVIFLIIGGINFSMHFTAWRKLSFRTYLKDAETCGWILTIVLLSAFISFLLVYDKTYATVSDAIYYGVTNTVFVISTGGFANTNYGEWSLVAQLLILLASCFATCAGSTGGGIKMIRAIALVKQGNLEFKRILHPKMVRPLKIGSQTIDKQVVFLVLAFLMLYTIIALFSTITFMLSGLDGLTAFSAALACLNNLGPALGSLGPAYNFASLNDFQIAFCCFLMVIGRLELFTVLVLFTRGFWRA
ncbi:TrkH family potassium uptake protein [Parasutterella muris]|jgi:Trk-type K+ transport systems, membrane components|uniref:Trk system potassium uptake protein n=2 Tax=Parasutterella TaxID=577310 RepID=A0A6L6YEI4_9BURK|nr:potassium transporter TrkG [Parasutterella muris]MVX55804.1 TrkH family potassium uptake protein [Parasutterella muris]